MFNLLIMVAALAPELGRSKCDNARTNVEMNECVSARLDLSEATMKKYLEAALKRFENEKDSDVNPGIRAAQNAFEAYRASECDTVYEYWNEGTIRDAMTMSCQADLVDKRTHDIWQHWLRYMDSTPPILPEPKPTK